MDACYGVRGQGPKTDAQLPEQHLRLTLAPAFLATFLVAFLAAFFANAP
jgi:hypothetical protein